LKQTQKKGSHENASEFIDLYWPLRLISLCFMQMYVWINEFMSVRLLSLPFVSLGERASGQKGFHESRISNSTSVSSDILVSISSRRLRLSLIEKRA
jgi:hypothetical protein